MLHSTRIPRVFIVSSSESLPIADVIAECLKQDAEVIPWSLNGIWEPGKFILQILLEQAPNYDFAVIILGRDDKTLSRGQEAYTPRDNVLFEAGMFMGQLGHTRTFVVAPKGNDLKILSDLAGLVLMTYDDPNQVTGLQGALKPVCSTICNAMKQQKIRQPVIAARSGPDAFGEAQRKVNKLLSLSRDTRAEITVLNIALDMEYTWGQVICDHVVKFEWPGRLVWRSLMIDAESEEIQRMKSDVVSRDIAMLREKQIVKSCEEKAAELKEKNIEFECRAYASIPLIHGFLVGSDLYVGFCWSENETLISAPYLVFNSAPSDLVLDAKIAESYIHLFKGWFAQHWETGRAVWPR